MYGSIQVNTGPIVCDVIFLFIWINIGIVPYPAPDFRESNCVRLNSNHVWRPLQVHAYILSYLKKEMPSLFGREKKKEELLMRLPEIYTILQREYHISPGDFPNVTKMQVP